MAWLEITIETASKKIQSAVTTLTARGFADLVIEDQEEFETFLEENRAYWDYIDEKLQGKKVDRIFMYNPDAVSQWVCEKYPAYIQEVTERTQLQLPMQGLKLT